LNTATLTYLFQEEIYNVPKKVLVVLAKAWDDYAPEDRALFTKILSSVKLSPDKVQIIVQNSLLLTSVSFYNPTKVLVFGTTTEGVKPYEAALVQDFWLIKADDLNQLDDAKKKNLWLALKTIFGL
jgi:hypothetical protein